MISGHRPRRAESRLARLAAAIVAACLPALAWGAWDVGALMSLLAKNPPGNATYSEIKHLALLDAPVESSGELRFVPPRYLERRTTAPGREVLIADGDSLVLERGGRRMTLSMRDQPEIAVLVESIRATLAGDRGTLETLHALSVAGGIEGWTLTLLPRVPAAARLVTRIDVSGKQARIHRIEIQMVGGDRSLMLIRKAGP